MQSSHHIFYKQHKLKKSVETTSGTNDFNTRTLFATNIPPYFDEQGLRNVFSYFGKVDYALIYSKPTLNPFVKLNSVASSSEKKKKSSYFSNATELNDNDKIIDETNPEFRVAYIIFNQVQSMEKALKKPLVDKERTLFNAKDTNVKTGLKS